MNVDFGGTGTPGPMVNLLDFASQSHHTLNRGGSSSQGDGKGGDRRGLLWLLDDEAIFPGSSDRTLLEKISSVYGDRRTLKRNNKNKLLINVLPIVKIIHN